MKPFNMKSAIQQALLALSAQLSSATEIVIYYVNDALGSPILILEKYKRFNK